jgi:tRNA threonylcarbamoyladenosine biosynthesis protein TsaE
MVFCTHSAQETLALGKILGQALQGGEVFAINGTLGTGKTHLVKGIVAGAGAADAFAVNSPTFVLLNVYEGRLTLYHIDAYRLNGVAQLEQLGFSDLLGADSVVLIEWAERVETALVDLSCVHLDLVHAGPTDRQIRLDHLPPHLQKHLSGASGDIADQFSLDKDPHDL